MKLLGGKGEFYPHSVYGVTKVREDESLAQGHTVDQLQMWDSDVHFFSL